MNWESMLMPMIAIGLAAIGGYGAYMTMRANFQSFREDSARRFSDSEADRKDLRSKIDLVERESVKERDFTRFEDRINTRFEKVEHAVNNGVMRTEQAVKNVMRDLLPKIRGGE